MSNDESSLNLSAGDFVYQSDQELFLVVTGINENSYEFAAHGWREIDKGRLEEYLHGENGQLYRQEEVAEFVEEEKSDGTQKNFDALRELFSAYEGGLSDEGPHERFKLDDTEP
jgi:hypothetical protein